MKKLLLLLAFLAHVGAARAAEPAVTLTFDPEENGALVYAPVAALSAFFTPTGRLWFTVKIKNEEGFTLNLTNIRVTLTGVDVTLPKVLVIAANTTKSVSLAEDETVFIPHPAAASVTIRLTFAENRTPKTVVLALAPYVPAVPGGKYFFPANEGDLGPEEYFSGGTHLPPEGQRWGADWSVHRVIGQGNTSSLRAGGLDAVNEDHLGWGIPIRAMADGVVLRTSTGWENNPAAGKRVFQMMAETDGEAITDVKVTSLGETAPGSRVQRVASLVRLPDNTFKITIWDLFSQSRGIAQRGSAVSNPGETVKAIAVVALGGTRLVTSVRLADDTHRVMLWQVSADGQTVERSDAHDEPAVAVTEVSLAKMAENRLAAGLRTTAGDLRVAVYDVSLNETVVPRGVDSGDAASSVGVASLSETRFAASVRASTGALKVIVWDVSDSSPYPLLRRGEATAENVSRVATALSAGGKWVTAMRTSPGGLLKLARWSATGDNPLVDLTLTPELVTNTAEAIENTALAIAPGSGSDKNDNVASTAILAGGVFQINGWGDPGSLPGSYEESAERTAGTVTAVSIDQTGTSFFVVGARTAAGNFKLMTWHWGFGGGNSVYLLHGDCRVLYAHFQDGSVNTDVLYPGATVGAGQVLGRMGNSGSSGGPHTHIHADRVFPLTSIDDMIAREALGTLPLIGARPIPFSSARTMRLAWIFPGGEGHPSNNFTTMTGHGMFELALGIRPGINTRYVDPTVIYQAFNGRKEPVPGSPATGGPMPTPGLALGGVPAGGTLYLRGRSYNEAITFSTPMTVRRYDFYETGGPAIIGQ